ncbi:MAG: radical SAM family heme chaperone HemW [Chloroflexi bacterium]|nr:radical SAM family heme chaperone HemW [Chloroflexota bacterium]
MAGVGTGVSSSTVKAPALQKGIALYLHIPFCQTKCSYCDFNTYARLNDLIPEYVVALSQELALWGRLLDGPQVNTIFFGGGTPSLLTPEQLGSVLNAARQAFQVAGGAEITVEANPEDVTLPRMVGFRAEGVNRLSIGVQSLDEGLLKGLDRRHSAGRAEEAYLCARRAGFDNISLDLMYGLVSQRMEQWQATLRRVLGLRPEHLSAYCLSLEPGTPMERRVRSGHLPEPNADLAADMYLLAEQEMSEAGYAHYEISNWALPGRQSRHNLTYWHNQPYLGIGPGAHSYLADYRFSNLLSPKRYIKQVHNWVQAGAGPGAQFTEGTLKGIPQVVQVERIGLPLEMAETAMLALRLDEGLDRDGFHSRFDCDVLAVFGEVIAESVEMGLLALNTSSDGRERLFLTPRGRLLANEVFWRLLQSRTVAGHS